MKPLVSVLLAVALLMVLWFAFGARRSAPGIAPLADERDRAHPPAPLTEVSASDGARASAVELVPPVDVVVTAVADDSSTLPDEPEERPPGFYARTFGMEFYESKADKFSVRAIHGANESSLRIVSYHAVVPGHPEKFSEIVPTKFWPTDITKLSESKLAVGGMVPENGHSIIEVWRFDPPRAKADAPGEWVPAKLSTVERIYDERSKDRHVVNSMMPMWGGPVEALLVGFRNSADLYSIDAQHRCRLVASAKDIPGVVHAPFLSHVSSGGARELVDGGYVYLFTDEGATDFGEWTQFFIEDTNRDGVIDRARTLTPKEYAEQGYDRTDAWVH
jgi:hypothetical protein